MVIANKHPSNMRNNQTDPSDHTAQRNRHTGHQCGKHDNNRAQTMNIAPQRTSLFFIQRQKIHFPAQRQKYCNAGQDDHARNDDIFIRRTGQTSHQPNCNGWQFFLGIRNIFNKGNQCVKQCLNNNTREYQSKQLRPTIYF